MINPKLYLVGGLPRDLLLNTLHNIEVQSKDIDIVFFCEEWKDITSPSELERIAIQDLNTWTNENNFEVVEWTEATYTARTKIKNGLYIDIAIPRKEIAYTSSRVPKCKVSTSITEDALRRDLTINSLYIPTSIEKLKTIDRKNISSINFLFESCVEDPTKLGIPDLKNRVLRISRQENAETTFIDDPLRVLRVLRFKCKLEKLTQKEWAIENRILDAWKDKEKVNLIINRIYTVSTERVMEELQKILETVSAKKALEILNVLPEELLNSFLREELRLKPITVTEEKKVY